jgi:probable HAF family extracellular repeat protein
MMPATKVARMVQAFVRPNLHNMKSPSRFASLGLALLALTLPQFASAATPTLVDTGLDWSWPTAINQSGQVIGSFNGGAFFIDPTTGVQVLPQFGAGDTYPTALNDAGLVLGNYNTGGVDEYGSSIVHAFIWSQSAGYRDLGTLPGGEFVWVSQLNSAGHACGAAESSNGLNHAVIWDGTTLRDLGTLGGPGSSAEALNNRDQVTGYADRADGSWAPFIWDAAGGMREIPAGQEYAQPYGINEDGVVFMRDYFSGGVLVWDPILGARTFPDPNPGVGYFSMGWRLKGFFSTGEAVFDNMRMTGSIALVLDPVTGWQPISLPGGSVLGTGARGFSKAGYIVGHSPDETGTSHAFIWDQTNGIRVLPTLGGEYTDAWAVNDLGQVTGGSQTAAGEYHAFLWDATNGIQDLGNLGGADATGYMISNGGLAGYYNLPDYSVYRTFYAKLDNPTTADTVPPVLSLPANRTVNATSTAGAVVTFTATATDNVNGSVPVTLSKVSGSVFAFGTTTVTATARDAAGNTASGSFTITVVNGGPALTLPANITTEATGPNGANVSFSASALDVVTGQPRPVKYSKASDSKFPLGTTTITVTATAADKKVSTGTFTVTVRDTIAPTLTLPANRTVKAKSAAGSKVNFNVGADDLVDRNVKATCSPASGSTFPLGTTTVIVTATDDSGNSTSASFTVTVSDQTKPTFASRPTVAPKSLATTNLMVSVTVTATAKDKVDAAPTVRIIAITCDETIAPGDAVITGALTASLRASRDAAGNGRIYTLTIQAADASGNTRTRTVHVLVPKKTNTKFEECDRTSRTEEKRFDDEDRDNDGRDRGDEDDND